MLPVRRGGVLLTSVFSCTLLEDAAVGRIIRARNPSSAATDREVLGRDALVAVELDRANELFVAVVGGFAEASDARKAALGALLAAAAVAGGPFSGFSCFAAEDAVGAVRCDGSLTACVVGFGCGFTAFALLLPIISQGLENEDC